MVLEVLRFVERGPKIESAHKERGVWRGSTVVASSVREGAEGAGGQGQGHAPFAPRCLLASEGAGDHIKRRASHAARPSQKDEDCFYGGTMDAA